MSASASAQRPGQRLSKIPDVWNRTSRAIITIIKLGILHNEHTSTIVSISPRKQSATFLPKASLDGYALAGHRRFLEHAPRRDDYLMGATPVVYVGEGISFVARRRAPRFKDGSAETSNTLFHPPPPVLQSQRGEGDC